MVDTTHTLYQYSFHRVISTKEIFIKEFSLLHFSTCLMALKLLLLLFFHFFNVGPPKEGIISGHLLSPIFQSTLHITFTSLCLLCGTVRFSCLLLCAQNLIQACLTSILVSLVRGHHHTSVDFVYIHCPKQDLIHPSRGKTVIRL